MGHDDESCLTVTPWAAKCDEIESAVWHRVKTFAWLCFAGKPLFLIPFVSIKGKCRSGNQSPANVWKSSRSEWKKSVGEVIWFLLAQLHKKKYCLPEDSELRRFQGSLQPAYCFSTACCKQYTVLKISRNAHSPWRAGVCKVVKNHFRSWKRKLISWDSAYSTLERAHWTCRYCHRCTIRVSI